MNLLRRMVLTLLGKGTWWIAGSAIRITIALRFNSAKVWNFGSSLESQQLKALLYPCVFSCPRGHILGWFNLFYFHLMQTVQMRCLPLCDLQAAVRGPDGYVEMCAGMRIHRKINIKKIAQALINMVGWESWSFGVVWWAGQGSRNYRPTDN